MTEVKARTVSFIKHRLRQLGAEVERSVQAQLSPAAAQSYADALPLSMLPLEHIDAIYKAAAPVLFPGHRHPLRELGRAAAADNLNSLYRVVMRLVSVPTVIEKGLKLWRTYHTKGDMTLERPSERRIIVVVTAYPELTDAFRETISGHFSTLMEAAGAKQVRIERDDRPPTWRWIVDWS